MKNFLKGFFTLIMKILKNIFVDIPMFFSKNSFTGDVNVRKDALAIKESIKNIILTLFSERPFDPEFGTNLTTGLFENPNDFSFYIENNISVALERYEPRIKLISIESSFEGRTLTMEIKYTLINPIGAGNNSFDVFDSLSLGVNTSRFLTIPTPSEPPKPFQEQFDIVFKYLMNIYEPGWSGSSSLTDVSGAEITKNILGISGPINPFVVGGLTAQAYQYVVSSLSLGASAGWFNPLTHPRLYANTVRSAYVQFERARSPAKANLKFIDYATTVFAQDVFYDKGGPSNTYLHLGKDFRHYPHDDPTYYTDGTDLRRSILSKNLQLNYDNRIERVFLICPYGFFDTSMPTSKSGNGGWRATPWMTDRYSGDHWTFDQYLKIQENTTLRDMLSSPDTVAGRTNGLGDIHLNTLWRGRTFDRGSVQTKLEYGRPGGYTQDMVVGTPWIQFPTGLTWVNPTGWFGNGITYNFDRRTMIQYDGVTQSIEPPFINSNFVSGTPTNYWNNFIGAEKGICFSFGQKVINDLNKISEDWSDKIEFIAYMGNLPYGPNQEISVPWMLYKDPRKTEHVNYFRWRLEASASHWKEKFKSPHDGYAHFFIDALAPMERTYHQYTQPGLTIWSNIYPDGVSFVENIPVTWFREKRSYLPDGISGPDPSKGFYIGLETFGQYMFKHDAYYVDSNNREQSRYLGDSAPRHFCLDDDIALDLYTGLPNMLLGQRKHGFTYSRSIWGMGVCGSSKLGEIVFMETPPNDQLGGWLQLDSMPFWNNVFIERDPSYSFAFSPSPLRWKYVPGTTFDNLGHGVPWNRDRRYRLFYLYPLILALNGTIADYMHCGSAYYTLPYSVPDNGWFDIKLGGITFERDMEYKSGPTYSNIPFPNRKTPLTPPRNYWTGDKSTSYFELLYACMKGGITLGLDSLYFNELYSQLKIEGATGFSP